MNAPDVITMSLSFMADTSGAVSVMRDYVGPTIRMLASLASVASVFFLITGGYSYITSRGNPQNLEQAKRTIRNALLGLIMVIAAATIVSVLSGAYGAPAQGTQASLPTLEAIEPNDPGNGLVDVLIKAVVGFLNNIIQAVGKPFLSALSYFTTQTPLMAKNSSVFNLWLAMVGISNVLLIVVVALLGFHVMSASTFGFDELDFKQLLPRVGLIFLAINSSIFLIDALIELSNVLITAIGKVGGSSSVWQTLTSVVGESGNQGAAALLVMLIFLIFSIILLVYYVGRLVTLFLGAVLSPLVIMISLIPAFRDFTVSAIKTYIITIFVLFVHVVTLQLASSLFVGMSDTSSQFPNTLMSMVIGLATVLTLLKTQGVMMQFGYVSLGARNARKLGGQFMNGISYLSGKGSSMIAAKSSSSSSRMNTSSSSARTTRISSFAASPTPAYAKAGNPSRGSSSSNFQPNTTVYKSSPSTSEATQPTLRSQAASLPSKDMEKKS